MLCIVLGHDGSALSDITTGSAGAREAVVAEWCAHGENRTDRRTIAVRSRACRFGLRFGGLLGHAPCCLDPCPLCSQLIPMWRPSCLVVLTQRTSRAAHLGNSQGRFQIHVPPASCLNFETVSAPPSVLVFAPVPFGFTTPEILSRLAS